MREGQVTELITQRQLGLKFKPSWTSNKEQETFILKYFNIFSFSIEKFMSTVSNFLFILKIIIPNSLIIFFF